jgi:hypothetical protein
MRAKGKDSNEPLWYARRYRRLDTPARARPAGDRGASIS